MKEYKIGIGIGVGYPQSVEEDMRMAKAAGFDAIFTGWSRGKIQSFADSAVENDLIYQSVHAPYNRVNHLWEDSEEGMAVTKELIDCVNECADAKVPLVVIHAFIGFEQHNPTETGVNNFRKVAEAAGERGIKIGFENVEGEEYLTAVMDALGDMPQVGFNWDTGHEMCYNGGKDTVSLWGKKLFGTHFNDNMGTSDPAHITWHDDLHLLPFDGIVDWKRNMERIGEKGYEGIITYELTIHNKPDKHYHDKYAGWTPQEFYDEAYKRAARVERVSCITKPQNKSNQYESFAQLF